MAGLGLTTLHYLQLETEWQPDTTSSNFKLNLNFNLKLKFA